MANDKFCLFPVSDIHPVCCAYNRGLLVGSTLLQMLFSGTSGGDDATIASNACIDASIDSDDTKYIVLT